MRRYLVFALGAAGLAALPFLACYKTGDLGDTPFKCSLMYPECPDGYRCQTEMVPAATQSRCVRNQAAGMPMSGIMIPKANVFQGTYTPSGLMLGACGDESFEPNNDFAAAQLKGFIGNGPLDKLAICPDNDIDIYSIALNDEFLKVTIKFALINGDLDLAIFDINGKLVPNLLDNDATKSDACVVSGTPLTGSYFIVVVGAKNATGQVATSRYTLQFTPVPKGMPRPVCGAMPADMAVPPDAE